MQRKGPLPGKIFAWCILQRRFAGHFEYMESISCQNQLILDAWRRYLATKGRFYRLRLLRECIRVIFCQECGSSSDRSALRRRFVQRARLRLSEMSLENASSRNVALRLFGNALQRCFVWGPSSAQANERWLLRCSAHVGLPLRCRGALGDAVLRSFGCWMSPLMRWRWSGRSMSGCRYRCRCGRGCRCCPRRCRVLAGDSDYRVLHGVDVLLGHRMPKGVDVLGHCVKRGVGEWLGNHVNQGFGGRRHHGVSALRALAAAMRIAQKRNRPPQNGAGRDDGSSQCSLL